MSLIRALHRINITNLEGERILPFDQIQMEFDRAVNEIINPYNIAKTKDAESEAKRAELFQEATEESKKYRVFSPSLMIEDGKIRPYVKSVYTDLRITSPFGIESSEVKTQRMKKEFMEELEQNGKPVVIGGTIMYVMSSRMDIDEEEFDDFPSYNFGTRSMFNYDIPSIVKISDTFNENEEAGHINTTHTSHLDHLKRTPGDKTFLSTLRLEQRKHTITNGVKSNQAISTLRKSYFGSWDGRLVTSFEIDGGILHIAISSEKDRRGNPLRNSKYSNIEMFFEDKSRILEKMDYSSLGKEFDFEKHFKKVDFGEDEDVIYDIISEDAIFSIIAEFISQYRSDAFHVIESIVKNIVDRSQTPSLEATQSNLRVATEILMGSNSKIIQSNDDMTLAFNKKELLQKDGSNIIILDITDITDVRKLHRRVMVLPAIEPIIIMAYEEDKKVKFGWSKMGRKNHEYSEGNPFKIVYDSISWKPQYSMPMSRENLLEFMLIGTESEAAQKLRKYMPNPLSKNIKDIEDERITQKKNEKNPYSMLFGKESGDFYEKIMAEAHKAIEELGGEFFDGEEEYTEEEIDKIISDFKNVLDEEPDEE